MKTNYWRTSQNYSTIIFLLHKNQNFMWCFKFAFSDYCGRTADFRSNSKRQTKHCLFFCWHFYMKKLSSYETMFLCFSSGTSTWKSSIIVKSCFPSLALYDWFEYIMRYSVLFLLTLSFLSANSLSLTLNTDPYINSDVSNNSALTEEPEYFDIASNPQLSDDTRNSYLSQDTAYCRKKNFRIIFNSNDMDIIKSQAQKDRIGWSRLLRFHKANSADLRWSRSLV